MRTNKACPYYEKNNEVVPSMNVAMTEEEEVEIEKSLIVDDDEELVKIDGTKMQLSGKLFKVRQNYSYVSIPSPLRPPTADDSSKKNAKNL